MNLISRLFRSAPDPREALRPLWHRIVALSREPEWYEECGVADSVPGRFDMISTILALVLLRLERDGSRPADTALLTELFVEDMDGQLRQSGIGDVVVGKHIGRLIAVLGGRLGAYRGALAEEDNRPLEEALRRNVTMLEGRGPEALAARLRDLHEQLRGISTQDLLAGRIER
jgi:cytochrome b pre-mRNA-processing protein 3